MKRIILALAATGVMMVYGLSALGEEMHSSMHEQELSGKVMLDRLERRDADADALTYWAGQAWFGSDRNKLWLKSEGSRIKGSTEEASLEAFYSNAAAPFWDLQIGARHDFAVQNQPSRNWLALGVRGLAPYKFDIDTTVYVGDMGRAALRTKVGYDLQLTQRLVLMPEFDMKLYKKNDVERGIGTGLSNIDLGLRLRYEFRREFAPYVGVVRIGKYGDTANQTRDAGLPVRDTQWVIGVRVWW